MGKVFAAITTSVDGYVAGPDDSPGRGLGIGGERLHYWVFGGPWTYAVEPKGQATGADREWLDNALSALGAVIAGRWTYEAADHWGGSNPWDAPFFIVTHRHEEQPDAEQGFTFVGDLETALQRAQEAAGDKRVHIMGGADLIRQALASGVVEEFSLIIAPVVLGGGKRLFDGFDQSLELEHLGVRQSPLATFIDYRVVRPTGP